MLMMMCYVQYDTAQNQGQMLVPLLHFRNVCAEITQETVQFNPVIWWIFQYETGERLCSASHMLHKTHIHIHLYAVIIWELPEISETHTNVADHPCN